MLRKWIFWLPFLFSFAAFAKDPVRVAVLDTGLDLKDARFTEHLCKKGHRDFTGFGIQDDHGHGTHVAGLIQEWAGAANYCLLILKYYSEGEPAKKNMTRYLEALQYAVAQGASIVNISGGGTVADQTERALIKSHPHIRFVVAAGNDHQEIFWESNDRGYFPASYRLPNVIAVGGLDRGRFSPGSNWGEPVQAWEDGWNVYSTVPYSLFCKSLAFIDFFTSPCTAPMSGTSQATAIHTGKILRKEYEDEVRKKFVHNAWDSFTRGLALPTRGPTFVRHQ